MSICTTFVCQTPTHNLYNLSPHNSDHLKVLRLLRYACLYSCGPLLGSQVVQDRCIQAAKSPRTILQPRNEVGQDIVGSHTVTHSLDFQGPAFRDPFFEVLGGSRPG